MKQTLKSRQTALMNIRSKLNDILSSEQNEQRQESLSSIAEWKANASHFEYSQKYVSTIDSEMIKNYQNQIYRIRMKYGDVDQEIRSLNQILQQNQMQYNHNNFDSTNVQDQLQTISMQRKDLKEKLENINLKLKNINSEKGNHNKYNFSKGFSYK